MTKNEKTQIKETIQAQNKNIRHAAKASLVDNILKYTAIANELDSRIKVMREELLLAMTEDGDTDISTDNGKASRGTVESYEVIDPKALLDLFSHKTIEEKALYLASKFSPKKAFVEGARELGRDIDKAIVTSEDPRFTVAAHRSKEAKQNLKTFLGAIEESKSEDVYQYVEALLGRR